MIRRTRTLAIALPLTALLAGCHAGEPAPPSVIRLTDLYEPETVEAASAVVPRVLPRTEWRFDADGPKPAWGVGRVGGRSALLGLTRSDGGDDQEPLHTIQIRMRASSGSGIEIEFDSDPPADLDAVADDAKLFGWDASTPLVADGTMRTYVLSPRRPVFSRSIRHVTLRVADAAVSDLAIESVRLVFRKEHLAGVPSGVGWQGLSEIYHETIVSRAPEAIRLDVRVPRAARLDLNVGTIENAPVTFRLDISRRGSAGDPLPVLRRTVTMPHRWEPVSVDLTPFSGRAVTLTLSLQSEEPGAIGFWGSPAVRGELPRPAADRPQGVILIWADTMRRDHLSVYGYARRTSPFLERLASEGATFTRCAANATWTKVSTPSLMTSLLPPSHGVAEFDDRLPASATTMAELYREAGYATISFSSILFTGKFTNLHQGFEQVHEDGSLPPELHSKTARAYVDRLLPWLEAHREDPFFVFLHVSDPHDPFEPYAPYDSLWADPARREAHLADAEKAKAAIVSPLLKRFGMPNREELIRAGVDPDAYVEHERDWYDGSIRGMDAEIGRLVERLESLGLADRTLIVFTADHGEEFLEHGRMFHGQSVYGELAGVPLILRWPGGVRSGTVVDRTVQLTDVMPTLLELSGVAGPDEMQGRSLAPLLRASSGKGLQAAPPPGDEGAFAFVQKARTRDGAGAPPPIESEAYALEEDGWKLVWNVRSPDGGPVRPEYELYDAARDALDLEDLASSRPDLVSRLAERLKAVRARAEAARLKPDSDAMESLGAEELERLRSLGYIQ